RFRSTLHSAFGIWHWAFPNIPVSETGVFKCDKILKFYLTLCDREVDSVIVYVAVEATTISRNTNGLFEGYYDGRPFTAGSIPACQTSLLRRASMKRATRILAASLAIGGGITAFGGAARADLVGGTYTTVAAASSWPGTPAYSTSLSGLSAQGFPGQDANADGAILSELVTPSTNLTLGAITIDANGFAT